MNEKNTHVRYQIAIPNPRNHYYHVMIEISEIATGSVDLKLPTWLPGAYKLNDFARDVEHFRAFDLDGKPISWEKTDKQTWSIAVPPEKSCRVEYDIYAFTLEDDASYICEEFAILNPGASIMMVEPKSGDPCSLEISLPTQWRNVTTGMTRDELTGLFLARDYHELMDCPIMMGNHEVRTFIARNIPHELVIEGRANIDLDTFIDDLRRIAEVEIDMMQHVPYQRYVFFMLLTDKDAGLEHRNSTLIFCKHHDFKPRDNYIETISIFAHELFHAWNVKTLRPAELISPDYFHETYTRGLWFSEGFTNYYHFVFLHRAGVITHEEYTETLAKLIHKYRLIPGRNHQSASDASFDTWIKYYRQDENTQNAEISYYLKGSHIAFLLDLIIQSATRARYSLDDLMRSLYRSCYLENEIGFTNDTVQVAASELCGQDLRAFFDNCLNAIGDLPFEEYLKLAGIDLQEKPQPADQKPHDVIPGSPGARVREHNYRVITAYVNRDGAAQNAGLQAFDEILAVDGFRVHNVSVFNTLMKQYPESSTVRFLIARHDQIRELTVVLGPADREGYLFKPSASVSEHQTIVFQGVMGYPHSEFLMKNGSVDQEKAVVAS